MQAKKLRITFPRQLNDYQEKTLIGHLQSIREEFGRGLTDMQKKINNPAAKLLLRTNKLTKEAIETAITGLAATNTDGKPVFHKLFFLGTEDKQAYLFTYPDVAEFAQYIPVFGGFTKGLSGYAIEKKMRKFISSTACDMGFTERSIKIEKVME